MNNKMISQYDGLLKAFADVISQIVVGLRYSADIVTHLKEINPELRLYVLMNFTYQ